LFFNSNIAYFKFVNVIKILNSKNSQMGCFFNHISVLPFLFALAVGICAIVVGGCLVDYVNIHKAWWTKCRATQWWSKPEICQRSIWSEKLWPVTVYTTFEFIGRNGEMTSWGMQVNCSDTISIQSAQQAYPANFSFVCAWSDITYIPLWLFPHGNLPSDHFTVIIVFSILGGVFLIVDCLTCWRCKSKEEYQDV
jgi:hypothetical protein